MVGCDNLFNAAKTICPGIGTGRDICLQIDIQTRTGIRIIKRIGTFTTEIGVITKFTDKAVITCTTAQGVVASATSQKIITRTAVNNVGGIVPGNGIPVFGPDDILEPGNGVIAIRAACRTSRKLNGLCTRCIGIIECIRTLT
ncbi:hypothetical protein, partial [uncultured Thalassospira sp.]|uniref:hypothetical protein n=1 Tax=uncultured Thalassospira sp. TaxID=404382 RepID=UPI002592A3D9